MYRLIEVRERTNTQMPQRRHTGVRIKTSLQYLFTSYEVSEQKINEIE